MTIECETGAKKPKIMVLGLKASLASIETHSEDLRPSLSNTKITGSLLVRPVKNLQSQSWFISHLDEYGNNMSTRHRSHDSTRLLMPLEHCMITCSPQGFHHLHLHPCRAATFDMQPTSLGRDSLSSAAGSFTQHLYFPHETIACAVSMK